MGIPTWLVKAIISRSAQLLVDFALTRALKFIAPKNMEVKMNIVQLNKLVEASCGVANVIGKVLEDGKVNIADLPNVFSLLQALQRFADVKYAEIPAEIKDLSDEELAILADTFKKYFDIPQDNIEHVVENGLTMVLQLFIAIKKLTEAFKPAK